MRGMQKINKIAGDMYKRNMERLENMCEQEFIRIIEEMVLSGDFMQHIGHQPETFALTYAPYRDKEILKEENKKLKECVELYKRVLPSDIGIHAVQALKDL